MLANVFSNGRFNVSLIKGQHTIKTGAFWEYGLGGGHRNYNVRAPEQVGGLPVTYVFNNGRPTSLTEFISPNLQVDQLNPDLGLFVQDQWHVSRFTVSAGVRYEWLRESAAAPRTWTAPAASAAPGTDREWPSEKVERERSAAAPTRAEPRGRE